MAWVPHPSEVVKLRSFGEGDMGSLTDPTVLPRFRIPGRYVFVYAKIKFTAGSGSADLQIMRDDHDPSGVYNFQELEVSTVGFGGTAEVTIKLSEADYPTYSFEPGDDLVFIWTDPDAGKASKWGIEVGLVPIS